MFQQINKVVVCKRRILYKNFSYDTYLYGILLNYRNWSKIVRNFLVIELDFSKKIVNSLIDNFNQLNIDNEKNEKINIDDNEYVK